MKAKKKDLTTGAIARYCQVTHFTVTNWINAGKLRAYRTPGGHHRIRREDFLEFLLTYQLPIPEDFALQTLPRILIVDDDRAVVEVLVQALHQVGYQVESASDGYEAGLKMATFKPDLLVLDLIMPRMNGFELCARIKGNPQTQGVKIIAITGYVQEESIERAFAAGADVYLEKPFRPDQLLKEIHRLLNPKNKGNGETRHLERRKTQRIKLPLPIRYSFCIARRKETEQIVGKGKTVDISTDGLLFETVLPLRRKNLLELEISLLRDNQPIRADGEVRWVKKGKDFDHKVGIQFTRLSSNAKEQLLEQLAIAERNL